MYMVIVLSSIDKEECVNRSTGLVNKFCVLMKCKLFFIQNKVTALNVTTVQFRSIND